MSGETPIWADPAHPTNRIRPRVVCAGCGTQGCVTHWGPWCFDCNVKRMARLSASFARMKADVERLEKAASGND